MKNVQVFTQLFSKLANGTKSDLGALIPLLLLQCTFNNTYNQTGLFIVEHHGAYNGALQFQGALKPYTHILLVFIKMISIKTVLHNAIIKSILIQQSVVFKKQTRSNVDSM